MRILKRDRRHNDHKIFTKEKQSDKRDGHEELMTRETGDTRMTEPFFWAIPSTSPCYISLFLEC